ncbi:SIR2 family protein [Devosia sp.]|uniref:SIR2 family protein n=1 Tax=Devosia sp. TaxID=1871048 RepID=UPI0029317209|nr:SIR2 family protein [Devosia sp.]
MVETIEVGTNQEELSKLLGGYLQSGHISFLIGSGASLPAIKTAGDIEREINDLIAHGDQNAANLKCAGFIEAIDAVHAGIGAAAEPANVTSTLKGYSDFLAVLDRILFLRKNLLLPRQANIFTTNYDLFIEHVSSRLPGLVLNDGFDRTSAIGNAFPFAPERYFDRTYRSGANYGHQIEVPTINLIKLHGSLSWRHEGDGIVFDRSPAPALSTADKGDAAKVENYLKKHFLVLPNLKKFHSTLMDRVYYDLLRLLANAMDRENAVLICFGFSFLDEHILDITRRALRNPTAQLIIVSYDKASCTGYETKFAGHRNVTILSPAAGTKIGYSEFNKLLRSVLPGSAAANAA